MSVSRVSIYVVHYNKMQFLTLQHHQLIKHCLDNFDYIVVNNGIDWEISQQISEYCKLNRLSEIIISHQDRRSYCSHDHIMALDQVYRKYLADDKHEIRVVMDSDVIPYSNFSFFDILGIAQIAGFRTYNFSSAIFTMYSRTVDLNGFNINAGGDSGSGTGHLVQKYKTKWINLTAPIREEEARYIFHYKNDKIARYSPSYGIQLLEECLVHFYRGTGWDNGDPNYFRKKFEFLMQFLLHSNMYGLRLDENVMYPDAFNDQWLYPKEYRLYKIPGYELPNLSNQSKQANDNQENGGGSVPIEREC